MILHFGLMGLDGEGALPELKDPGGRGLARHVKGGAFAASAFRQGLFSGEAGDFRVIVGLAQVGEHQHLGRAIKVIGEKSRRRQIGEVAMAAHHPLFDVPRIGPDFEHIQIVIRLEDETLAAFHSLLNDFVNIPKISHHPHLYAFRFEGERHGVGGVMGDGKRRDFDVADDELLAGGDESQRRKASGPR